MTWFIRVVSRSPEGCSKVLSAIKHPSSEVELQCVKNLMPPCPYL